MKILIIIICAASLLINIINPAQAISERAAKFIQYCSLEDMPWPPAGWTKSELREAALEVLDAIENGSIKDHIKGACLQTLGYTQNPDDLPRIMAYKDRMPKTVLRSLKGFPHPDAINYLIEHVNSEKQIIREIAIKGIADVDFRKLKEPEKWKSRVLDVIKTVLKKEKVDWLKKDIEKALKKVEEAKTE